MSRLVVISPSAFRVELDALAEGPLPTMRMWQENYLHIDPAKVVDDCGEPGVAVVCLGPDLPIDVTLSMAEAFDRDRPDLCVVILAEPSVSLWEGALRAGVREIIPRHADLVTLEDALMRASHVADRRQSTMARAQVQAQPATRVITVLSPKGGSGKTTIATNVAVGLSKAQAGRVVVIDLDLQFGDVAAALQLAPQQTLADVAHAPSDLDATMLKVFLCPHPSGIFALCAPDAPAAADDITVAHAATTIELLRSEFPFVVVDTGAGMSEHTLAAIESSTDLIFVGAMDVTSVRSLRKEIEVLERLELTAARRHFVLNRADAKVGMDTADIEAMLGMAVDVALPSSRLVPLSSNEGTPLLEGSPARSPIARSLDQIVHRFLDQSEPQNVPAGSRWRRKEIR